MDEERLDYHMKEVSIEKANNTQEVDFEMGEVKVTTTKQGIWAESKVVEKDNGLKTEVMRFKWNAYWKIQIALVIFQPALHG